MRRRCSRRSAARAYDEKCSATVLDRFFPCWAAVRSAAWRSLRTWYAAAPQMDTMMTAMAVITWMRSWRMGVEFIDAARLYGHPRARLTCIEDAKDTVRLSSGPSGGTHEIHRIGYRRSVLVRRRRDRADARRPQERREELRQHPHLRHGLPPAALQPAQADRQEHRQAPGAGVEPEPRQQLGRAGAADRVQRGDDRHQRQGDRHPVVHDRLRLLAP